MSKLNREDRKVREKGHLSKGDLHVVDYTVDSGSYDWTRFGFSTACYCSCASGYVLKYNCGITVSICSSTDLANKHVDEHITRRS